VEFIDLKSQYRAIRSDVNSRIQAVLEHGQYILGPEVRELEQRLATYVNSANCVTVASGTEALLIALMALGVGPGDEVITTPFSFVASAEVIVLVGAKPVFVDVEPDTANLDASLLDAAIGVRTKAIIPVSLYGQPADMDEISAIAARRGPIAVIEDAAQSFGASYHGRRSGALSAVGCTSFFPSKPLGCYGDGGAIFTDDAALAQACSEIRVAPVRDPAGEADPPGLGDRATHRARQSLWRSDSCQRRAGRPAGGTARPQLCVGAIHDTGRESRCRTGKTQAGRHTDSDSLSTATA